MKQLCKQTWKSQYSKYFIFQYRKYFIEGGCEHFYRRDNFDEKAWGSRKTMIHGSKQFYILYSFASRYTLQQVCNSGANRKDYFKISYSHFPLNISFYFQQPELGTRQHCRDTVTMISVHKMIDYWTSSILVAATPVGHQDLNIFRIFYVTEALLLLLSRS